MDLDLGYRNSSRSFAPALADGNTLISDQFNNIVIEVTHAKKIVFSRVS